MLQFKFALTLSRPRPWQLRRGGAGDQSTKVKFKRARTFGDSLSDVEPTTSHGQ